MWMIFSGWGKPKPFGDLVGHLLAGGDDQQAMILLFVQRRHHLGQRCSSSSNTAVRTACEHAFRAFCRASGENPVPFDEQTVIDDQLTMVFFRDDLGSETFSGSAFSHQCNRFWRFNLPESISENPVHCSSLCHSGLKMTRCEDDRKTLQQGKGLDTIPTNPLAYCEIGLCAIR
jgi:hypothetical protein